RETSPPPSSRNLPRRSLPLNPPAYEPPALKWGQQSDDAFVPRSRFPSTPHPQQETLPSHVRASLQSYSFPQSSPTPPKAIRRPPSDITLSPLEVSTPSAAHTAPSMRYQDSGGSRVPPKSALRGHREKGKKLD